MRNKYKCVCNKCWKTVKPNGGEVAKIHGRWVATHDACANTDADNLLRATIARQGDEALVNEQRVECYDTSQMNLKFERSRVI